MTPRSVLSSINILAKSGGSMILLVFLIVGCQTDVPISPVATPIVHNDSPVAVDLKAAIKFKQYNGQERFTLKPKSDGAKLEDASGQEILRLKQDSTQKIKIKDPQEQVLGYVVSANHAWKLKSPDQSQDLFVLRRQGDGDYQLKTGSNQLVYRLKVRDYGYEIETASKDSLYKIKTKGSKTLLNDSKGEILLYTKPPIPPVVMASFGLDALTEAQQTALAYALAQGL